MQDSLKLMLTESIDDSQAGALVDGFEVLIEVIRAVATPGGGTLGENHRISERYEGEQI